MRCCAYLLLIGIGIVACVPEMSNAQLFGKKPKAPPQQRVAELAYILKQDKDGHKRADAAEELRQYDPQQFSEIVPLLIDALQNDQHSSVRVEAATSLGRLRPISGPAGQALEHAAAHDSNLRVRLQAKTSLMYYQLSGYQGPKMKEPQGPGHNSAEPPLAGPPESLYKNTSNPKDKAPTVNITPGQTMPNQTPRPLPSGPQQPAQVPVTTVPTTPQPAPILQPPTLQPAPILQPITPQPGPILQPSTPPLLTTTPANQPATAPQQEGPVLVPPG
jgi:HEAT repeats